MGNWIDELGEDTKRFDRELRENAQRWDREVWQGNRTASKSSKARTEPDYDDEEDDDEEDGEY